MQSFDIELALMTLSSTGADEVSYILPKDYLIEHRSNTGWGYVLRLPDDKLSGDLNEQTIAFLTGLTSIMKWVKSSSSVLRVAVFHDFNVSAYCDINLDEFDLFVSSDLKLELTVYPVDETVD